jgi:hypothetical protein
MIGGVVEIIAEGLAFHETLPPLAVEGGGKRCGRAPRRAALDIKCWCGS